MYDQENELSLWGAAPASRGPGCLPSLGCAGVLGHAAGIPGAGQSVSSGSPVNP